MARRASAAVPDAPATGKVVVSVELPEAGGFSVLDPGEYEAEIVAANYGLSKADSKPKIDFEFSVTVDGQKRKLWATHSLQPQALFRLRNLTDACGTTQEGGKAAAQFEIDEPKYEGGVLVGGICSEFIGQWVGVIVGQEIYQGKNKNRIEEYFPLDGGSEPEANAP